jgi:branched-chain amino acid transport system permease protein
MRQRHLLWLAALAIALLLPLVVGESPYLMKVLIIMIIFIIYTHAWNLLAYSGQASLGHAAFFGIGGYASALLAAKLGTSPFLTIFIGAIFAAIAGVFVGIICVRLREWFLAMVTFGFSIIIGTIFLNQFTSLFGGVDGMPAKRFFSATLEHRYLYEYYFMLLLAIATTLLIYFIMRSRLGVAFAAIRENEMEAKILGVNTTKYKLIAFLISTYLAGLAGALQTHSFAYITPEIYSVHNSFWPVIYAIAGGLATLEGPIIGTVAITLIWEGLKNLGLHFERFVIIGLLLVVMVIFKPRGLASVFDRWRR